jgi:hypothetical protein
MRRRGQLTWRPSECPQAPQALLLARRAATQKRRMKSPWPRHTARQKEICVEGCPLVPAQPPWTPPSQRRKRMKPARRQGVVDRCHPLPQPLPPPWRGRARGCERGR